MTVPSLSSHSMSSVRSHPPRTIHVWSFGICIVIGGQFFSWNAGLVAGTVSYGLGIALMGMAYVCLTLSMAEVSSALPFAGGIYGLARCTIGFYLGFLAGCFEILEYLFFVTSGNMQISFVLLSTFPSLSSYQPIVWASIHLFCFVLVYTHGTLFWNVNHFFALLAMIIIFFYCLGAMTFMDGTQYSGGSEFAFIGGVNQFFTVLPLAAWPYSGIEAVTTLASDVQHPQKVLPKAHVWSMCTLLLTSWCIYLLSICSPPGVKQLSNEVAIMNGGFSASFNITTAESTFLSLPVVLASTPCFSLASSNIMAAMAQSKLLPGFLSHRSKFTKSPVCALVVVLLISFSTCFSLLNTPDFADLIYHLCMLFGFTTYIAQCFGYIYLKRYQSNLRRHYISPVGISGAVFATIVFIISAVSILVCHAHGQFYLIVACCLITLLTIYYVGYARHHQTFSNAEKRQYFFASIGKINYRKRSSRMIKLGGNSRSETPVSMQRRSARTSSLSFVPMIRRISSSIYVVAIDPETPES